MTHDNNVGHNARIEQTRLLTQDDLDTFARLSGDHNPIHVDPGFAVNTPFGATVAHGMLLFTLLRGVIEQHYPNARLQTQDLMFPSPAYADEEIKIIVQPAATPTKTRLRLNTEIYRADGQCCLQGQCQLQLTNEAIL